MLFSSLAIADDVLFVISVLFAILIKLPDQAEEVADQLVRILLPFIQGDRNEIYQAAARLPSHVICHAHDIDDDLWGCIQRLIEFNGAYDDKVCACDFFQSLSTMTRAKFFDLVPAEILFELLQSLRDRADAEHVDRLIGGEYRIDHIIKGTWDCE
jgi:hypothetical protein